MLDIDETKIRAIGNVLNDPERPLKVSTKYCKKPI